MAPFFLPAELPTNLRISCTRGEYKSGDDKRNYDCKLQNRHEIHVCVTVTLDRHLDLQEEWLFPMRNLAANIATVLDFGFVPGEWVNKPSNLPPGAKLAHQHIEAAKGQPMRPVDPQWIINYDFSSYYTWKPSSARNGGGDTWERSNSASNKTSAAPLE